MVAVAELWETLSHAIHSYTGLSPAAFFTAVAIAAALYHLVASFLAPPPPPPRSRDFNPEESEPLPPPVQLGEISEDELKAYDGSDPRSCWMGDDRSVCRKWDDMDTDVLVTIFKLLNMVEMGPVSQVCRLWRFTCSDPLIWKTIDLSRLKSKFIQTTVSPYIYVDDPSDKCLFRVLKLAMALSRGNVSCMIFHYNLYMKDGHLSYITERSPHLKRLVMPAWNSITKNGICQAIQRWPHLESLTMPTIIGPQVIIQEIGQHCKNLTELKIMGTFDLHFASSIIAHLPSLKVLSLRCSRLMKDALLKLLESAEKLEVLNISHCLILETVGWKQVVREIDVSILEGGSRMKVLVCQNKGCLTCQRMVNDEGLMRWYRYEEWFWRYDEVASLDLGEDSGKLFDAECEKLTAW